MSGQPQSPNPYAAPATATFPDLPTMSAGSEVTRASVEHLQQTRPWVLFLGILGLLGSLMMICGSGGMVFYAVSGAQGGGQFTVVAVMYVVMALVYIIPAVQLIRYSQRIASLVANPTVQNLESALDAQKRFWRFVGIVAAVILMVYVLILVGVFVFGLLGAGRMFR